MKKIKRAAFNFHPSTPLTHATLDKPGHHQQLIFGTKADTLKQLKSAITQAKVLDVVSIRHADWPDQRLWHAVAAKGWADRPLVVRSSALSEDNNEASNAGRYTSIIGVTGKTALFNAIKTVFNSYGDECGPQDQVLIQPCLQNVILAGVIMTADLDTLSPYYSVNYESSGSTDGVTRGDRNDLRNYVCLKHKASAERHPHFNKLFAACAEIEQLSGNEALDIEFAFDKQGYLYIFQVRPIVCRNKSITPPNVDLGHALRKLHNRIKSRFDLHPELLGKQPIYGVMPDWNPAEIIGVKPRSLAFSLYRELITDDIWAYQRDNYGYRNLRSHPLLVSFLGVPYVDVRVSFNSFVPKGLPDSIAEKLVNYYIDRLINNPHYHDKVEFEIVHSCYYLNLPERLEELQLHGFNANEIRRIEFALLNVTNKIIHSENGLFRQDLNKIEMLKQRYALVANSDLNTIEKIFWLIEELKRYGTLPFAGIARAGFIAVQFLRSFVELGILTQAEHDAFMTSLNSVALSLRKDLEALYTGNLSKHLFLKRYGHLRPGTYDILSPRYDEQFEAYFGDQTPRCEATEPFFFDRAQLTSIDQLLEEHGIHASALQLTQFIKEAIEGREYAKFIFTQPLSDILKLTRKFAEEHHISHQDISHLDIRVLKNCYTVLDQRSIESIMRSSIAQNKQTYEYTKHVKLPNTILKPDDVYSFFLDRDQPNFITLKQVEGKTVLLKQGSTDSYRNSIAFIESADPGYDFVLSHGICGLITKFGGANSHMAIRCAELGLPAVIGAGEQNFRTWSRASRLLIDGAARQVKVIA